MNNEDRDRLNGQLQGFDDKDILEQSLALSDIVRDLLATTRQQLNKVYIVLIMSILANLIIVGSFIWYESHIERTITETVTTQEVDGESSINNVKGDQYNDKATHKESSNERDTEK